MVKHIRNLGENTIARKVYEEQKANGWPGLAMETANICKVLNIENCNVADIHLISNKVYRNYVKQQCVIKDEFNLRGLAEGKEKCFRIMKGRFGKKSYISLQTLHSVRQHFLSRLGMQPFAGNYSSDKRFYKTNWMCKCNVEREDESHLLSGNCQVYGDIRDRYGNMEDDKVLVSFFSEVLARRERVEVE